jgi:tetrahydromethanopterin S-methyltransferase subunit G
MSKITIDDLAAMVKRGFDHQDKKFGDRFDRLEKRFDSLENKVDNIALEVSQIKKRLDKVEEILSKTNKRTIEDDNMLGKEIFDLKRRVKILEKKYAASR